MSIEIVSTGDLRCHRCLGDLYLAVRVPHNSWQTPPGTNLSATRLVPLCPRCDANRPAAQDLLAYFAVYSSVTESTLHIFADLLQRWVNDIDCPQIDLAEVDAEIQQWLDGEFD